jgi:molybdopterin-binding protein
MTAYRMRQAAELLGVSDDTVRRWADGGRLATTVDESGRRVVEGEVLARLAESLSTEYEAGVIVSESARNHFAGIVTRVVKDKVMAQVELQSGRHRLVSLMTREAADELGLAPGVLAVAAVKATNVVVNVPART